MNKVITTRTEGGIFEVTLDKPKANTINLETSRLMGDTFQRFRDDPSLRVAIVRTAGDKFFSAGWDLKAAADGVRSMPITVWEGSPVCRNCAISINR